MVTGAGGGTTGSPREPSPGTGVSSVTTGMGSRGGTPSKKTRAHLSRVSVAQETISSIAPSMSRTRAWGTVRLKVVKDGRIKGLAPSAFMAESVEHQFTAAVLARHTHNVFQFKVRIGEGSEEIEVVIVDRNGGRQRQRDRTASRFTKEE